VLRRKYAEPLSDVRSTASWLLSEKVWLVSFMQYDLGFFDHETDRVTSAENPFGAKVLPMCPE